MADTAIEPPVVEVAADAAVADAATDAPVAVDAAVAEDAAVADAATDAPVVEAAAVADAATDAEPSAPAAFAAVTENAPDSAATPLPDGAVAATGDGSAPEGHAVKGNAESRLYHVPGSQWYDATDAEFWFASAAAAEAAGFLPAGGSAKQQVEGADA